MILDTKYKQNFSKIGAIEEKAYVKTAGLIDKFSRPDLHACVVEGRKSSL